MGFLPPEQRDTRYYLWEPKFLCRVPYEQTFSIDDMRTFGMPTTMDRAMDRDMMKTNVPRYFSINQMFEYYVSGVPVAVVNRADTKTIYEHISNHLNAMKLEAQRAFTVDHIPFDDLIQLDEFANTVYEHAKFQFTRGEANSLIARRMKSIIKFSPTDLLGSSKGKKKDAAPVEEEEDPDSKYEKRSSLSNYFNAVAKRSRMF